MADGKSKDFQPSFNPKSLLDKSLLEELKVASEKLVTAGAKPSIDDTLLDITETNETKGKKYNTTKLKNYTIGFDIGKDYTMLKDEFNLNHTVSHTSLGFSAEKEPISKKKYFTTGGINAEFAIQKQETITAINKPKDKSYPIELKTLELEAGFGIYRKKDRAVFFTASYYLNSNTNKDEGTKIINANPISNYGATIGVTNLETYNISRKKIDVNYKLSLTGNFSEEVKPTNVTLSFEPLLKVSEFSLNKKLDANFFVKAGIDLGFNFRNDVDSRISTPNDFQKNGAFGIPYKFKIGAGINL